MSFIISKHQPIAFNPGLANKNHVDLDLQSIDSSYYDNVKLLDKDRWFYTNKSIDYIHNEYGYRSDLLSEIASGDEYIVTFGCSYSYGYGLHYEDTYSYKVSKHFNCKNINLSVCGTGIQFHRLNTTMFLNYLNVNSLKFPKLVIYQYPSWTRMRFSTSLLDNGELMLSQMTHNFDNFDKDITPFYKKYWIMDETEVYTEALYAPIYLHTLWNGYEIPTYHMDWGDFHQKYKSDFQTFDIFDYSGFNSNNHSNETDYFYDLARDLSHNGRDFHDRVANEIIEETKWLT